jgi:hypothetical protein
VFLNLLTQDKRPNLLLLLLLLVLVVVVVLTSFVFYGLYLRSPLFDCSDRTGRVTNRCTVDVDADFDGGRREGSRSSKEGPEGAVCACEGCASGFTNARQSLRDVNTAHNSLR